MTARDTIVGLLKQWAFWSGAAEDTPEKVADAYRAEVLREARDAVREHVCEPLPGEAYPGELAMLRGLVRTLRVVVRDDVDTAEVWRLLHQHVIDDMAARAENIEPAPAGDR